MTLLSSDNLSRNNCIFSGFLITFDLLLSNIPSWLFFPYSEVQPLSGYDFQYIVNYSSEIKQQTKLDGPHAILVEFEFGLNVVICGGRNTGEPGEKPSEQGDNQQVTQLTYGTEPESNPGHTGEKLASTIPAPRAG